MKKFLITILLTLCTLPALAENTILIVGDSLSAGYGIDPSQGWVQLLQQRLQNLKYKYHVVNASITGDTTSNGLQRLPAALKQYQPQITIIELGGNDALRGLPTPLIKNNLQKIIALTEAANSKVMLLGVRIPPNYGEAYTGQFQQIYQDFSQQTDLVVVPLFLTGIDTDHAKMQADGIHPLASAQPVMLENVWGTLQKLLHY